MKGLNAFLGWLLMLAVLAVPSFLFYNWWAKNKRQTAGETTVKSSVKDVFSAAGQRPAGAGPGMRDSGAAPAPVSSVSTITAGGAEPKPTSAPAAPAAADAAKTAAAPVPAARNPGQQAGSSDSAQKASFYAPKASRNPMLSNEDYRTIREQEFKKAEAERLARLNQNKRIKDSGIDNKLSLQGIVGNAAIINGEMYTPGQSIMGGKVLKVGANYVDVIYKGRTFRKTMR